MAENGGGQELDQLLITVDSEIGNLRGINSAITALQRLQGLTGNARGAIRQLGDLGVALKNFDGIGQRLSGIDNVTNGVHRMITALQRLTQVTGSANKAIGQLGKLGTTLNQSFSGIGTNLAGLESVSRGVLNLVTAIDRLTQVTGNANGASRQLGNLGANLRSFNGINLNGVADNIADPLERIMRAVGNLGNNNRVSIRIDQSGVANVNRLNNNLNRTMVSFHEFYSTLQRDSANVGTLFGDMFDLNRPTADLQRDLTRAERMLDSFENNTRNNFLRMQEELSRFRPQDLLNSQRFRNAARGEVMSSAMADHVRAQIDNLRNEIEQRGADELVQAWNHTMNAISHDVQRFNLGDLIDVNLPTDQLRANLRTLENQLAHATREMNSARDNMQRVAARIQDVNRLYSDEGYRGSYYTWRTRTEYVEQYRRAIASLNAELRSRDNHPVNEAEGLRQLPQLTQQLEQYRRMYLEMYNMENPSDEQQNQMEVMLRAINILETRIEGINNMLGNDIPNSQEGILEMARQISDEAERTARALEEARSASLANVSRGFEQFGGAVSSLNIPVLKELGNLSSVFGRSGARFLSAEQLAGIEGLAGTLGTVATAIGGVTAVVGVVVAAFKLWWNTMEKIRNAMTQFMQSCIQFAKNMLSTVVGAFNAVTGAVSKVVSMVESGAQRISTALRKIGEVASSIISVLGKIGGALAPAMKGVTAILSLVTPRFIKNMASADGSLKNIIKNTRVLNKLLQTTNKWATMLTRMLMRKIVQAFISGLKQAFDDLVVFEKNANDSLMKLNENVSMIFSAMRRGANQWIAAFEPVINMFTPMIIGFLDGVQSMGEAFAKFMAVLAKQPYYIRAIRFYEDYGETVEETNKKVKNLTNGLDELNILNDQKESGIKPEDMFEKVPIDSAFAFPSLQDIIDKIVDWLKNINWQKIWDKIQEFIYKFMDKVNEILARLDLWEWLGKTFGNLINTLLHIWNDFITKFDPKLLADALATFIINALRTIDWDLIHENIELTAKKFAQFWNEIFANEALWDEIVTFITNALNEVTHYFDTWAWTFDFGQMAQQLTDSVAEILDGYDWTQLNHAVEGWVNGLVDFINTAAANKAFWREIGEAIANGVDIIVNAFNKLADINFVDLVNSIKLAIEKALEIDWNKFYETVDKWAKNFADIINGFLTDEKFLTDVATSISHFINGIIELFDETLIKLQGYDIGTAIANALVSGLSNIHWNTLFMLPADALNALSNAIRGIFDSLPADFSLANWLIEHLSLTYDTIDWDLLERNLYEIGDRIIRNINDVIQNDDFWSRFGDLTVRGLKLIVKITEDLTQIDWQGLGQRITNYINTIISQHKIDDIISNIGTVAINLFFTITAVLKGVHWDELGKQIAEGINDVVDKIYENREKIKQDIIDAFSSFSTFMSNLLQEMLKNRSFAKIGSAVGEFLLGIISGIAIFFDENATNIIDAMKQFGDSLAAEINKHHDEIVRALNTIINAVCDILIAFFDEKGALWNAINDVIEDLDLDRLLKTFVEIFIKKLFAKMANFDAIWEGIGGLDGIIDTIVHGVKTFFKKILDRVKEKLGDFFKNPFGNNKGFLETLVEEGLKFAKNPPEYLANLILKLLGFETPFSLANIFKNLKFIDLDKALAGLKEKLKGVKDFFKKKIDAIKEKGFLKGLFGGEEAEIPVTADVNVNEKHNLEDVLGDTELQFEDAKLGKIKTDLIEATMFKGETLEVEEMFAETLTLTDIIADKLTVKEIETDGDTKTKKSDDVFGANDINVEQGVLSNGINADKITTKLIEVTEKITAPLLEVTEKITTLLLQTNEIIAQTITATTITTELLEAKKITTDLLEAKKITTKLLDAKKMTTKLLEAEKMWTKLLEIRDKITAEELEVEKKITADTLEVNKIEAKDHDLDDLTAAVQEVEKIITPLLEVTERITTLLIQTNELVAQALTATKITTLELQANKIMTEVINASTIAANALNVSEINSNLLKVSNIEAGVLNVGTINGTLSTQPTVTNVSTGGYPTFGYSDYTIQKPQFDKGDRWSDISGLVPSAEDFLDGFNDYYQVQGSSWGTTTLPRYEDTTFADTVKEFEDGITKVTTQLYLGGNSTTASSGTLGNSDDTAKAYANSSSSAKEISRRMLGDLPDYAQYIKDYLTDFIGNENGALGLMGNLYAESKLLTNNLQSTAADGGINQKDIDYTNSINRGANFLDNRGYGLAQWTTSDRKQGLLNSLNGRSVDDLDAQLEYLTKELSSPQYASTLAKLKNAQTISEASNAALYGFEKPRDAASHEAERWGYSKDLARLFATGEEQRQTYDIPDEPTPTGDTPHKDDDNLSDTVDEANVIKDETTGGGGSYPWSFLDGLPLQTEFTMAEVYNIIDKWLGRIYRLFKSFKVEDFLDELLNLEDLKMQVEGSLGIEILDDIQDSLKEIAQLLKKLLKNGIKCQCTCGGGERKIKGLEEATEAIKELTLAIEELTNVIRKLIASVDNNTKAIKNLIDVIKDLIDEIKKLISAINDIIGAIDKLIDSVDNLTPVINDLTDSVDDLTDGIKQLSDDISDLSDTITDLSSNILTLVDALNNNTAALEALTATIKVLISAIEDLTKAINELPLEQLAAVVNELTNAIKTLTATVERLITAINNLISALDRTRAAVEKLNSTIERLITAINSLISALDKFRLALDGLVTALNNLKSAIERLITPITNLVTAVKNNTSAIERLITAINNLISALNKLNIQGLNDSINKLIGSIDSLKAVIERLISAINNLIPALDKLTNAINALKNQIQNISFQELINVIRELTDAIKGLTKKADEIISAIDRWIQCAGDTGHLDRNTIAKSENTKAVEALTNAANRCADALINNTHLVNNTQAKSANTKAVEALNKNMGTFISNLQGTLSNINCNCNCNCSCGNCAMGTTGGGTTGGGTTGGGTTGGGTTGGGTTGGGYNPPYGGETYDGGGYRPDQNYDHNNQQADTGTIDRGGINPPSGTTNPPSGGSNTGDGGGYTPPSGTTTPPTGGYIAHDVSNGEIRDQNGNIVGYMDGSWGSRFIKNGQILDDAGDVPLKMPYVNLLDIISPEKAKETPFGGSVTIRGAETAYNYGALEEYKKYRDEQNQLVYGYRDEAKQYYDNVMAYGDDSLKAQAQSYYDWLMSNHNGQAGYAWEYENQLKQLKIFSANAKVNNNKDDNDYAYNPVWHVNPDNQYGVKGGEYRLWQMKNFVSAEEYKELKATFDEGNKTVDNWRNEAKSMIDFVNQHGTATQKKTLADAYKELTTNYNAQDVFWYRKQYDTIKKEYDKAKSNYDTATNTPQSISELDAKLASVVNVGDRMWEYAYPVGSNAYSMRKSAPNLGTVSTRDRQSVMDKTQAINPIDNGNFRPHLTDEEARAVGYRNVSELINAAYKMGSKAFKFVGDTKFKSQEFPKLFAKYKERFMAKGYQMGGMPNAGEIFVAREGGTPEFVGSFGGRTAVANNDQIVTAVANGVSMANDRMVSAIENQTNALENAIDRKNVDVQIGDRQIAEANNRGQKGLGNKFVE